MVLAKLIQAAGVRDTDHVLDVGLWDRLLLRRAGASRRISDRAQEDAELRVERRRRLPQRGSERVTLASGLLDRRLADCRAL